MKIKIWTLTTTIPVAGETEPHIPEVFATEAEAEAMANTSLRAEWDAYAPWNDNDDKPLPYPGDWRKANDILVVTNGEGSWGEWRVTQHEIDIGDLAVCVVGGVVQAVVANGSLIDQPLAVIDYDTDDAPAPGSTRGIRQDDGRVAQAYVEHIKIGKAGIAIPLSV